MHVHSRTSMTMNVITCTNQATRPHRFQSLQSLLDNELRTRHFSCQSANPWNARLSELIIRWNLLVIRSNPLVIRCNVLAIRCNPFVIRCNPLVIRCNPFAGLRIAQASKIVK